MWLLALRQILQILLITAVVVGGALVFAYLPVALLLWFGSGVAEIICLGFFCSVTLSVLGAISVSLWLAIVVWASRAGYLTIPEAW